MMKRTGATHLVGEVDRVAVAHQLRQLLRRLAAEERAVVLLEERRELLVARLVVADRDTCDAAAPELGVLAELEQRDVAAPRVARDHRALRVGDPARDEVGSPAFTSSSSGPPMFPIERVAPLAPVADRAAVVDHPTAKPAST